MQAVASLHVSFQKGKPLPNDGVFHWRHKSDVCMISARSVWAAMMREGMSVMGGEGRAAKVEHHTSL